jgi:hypothetical protein
MIHCSPCVVIRIDLGLQRGLLGAESVRLLQVEVTREDAQPEVNSAADLLGPDYAPAP